MDKKKKIVIAGVSAAVILIVIAISVALSVNKDSKYKDEKVTIPVTDENGVAVTDEEGKIVTELSTDKNDPSKDNKNNGSSKDNGSGSGSQSGNNNGNNGDKNNSGGNDSGNSDGGEKETTTKKPEKVTSRKISFTVNYPYYQGKKTKVKLEYKLSKDSDKKYQLIKEEELVMDKAVERKYQIDKKLKGDVDIRITINGVTLVENVFTIAENESTAIIDIETGIEKMDGGFD